MTEFVAEVIGTAILILLGNGVVANVLLRGTKGEGSGWIVINWGWGMAVFVAIFITARFSGAHLNPAVTLGLALAGEFDLVRVPAYILAQMIGAMTGAALVWVHYYPHWGLTENRDLKLAAFSTAPAVRNVPANFISEVIGTFVLVFGVLFLASPDVGLGGLDALPVGLLVFVIGVSLGGTTGYAINPARDLGPRIVHALLPMPGGKRDSDWRYSWIPVAGPLAGAVVAALLYLALSRPQAGVPMP
jgi:glycerol uptake facilitator protein